MRDLRGVLAFVSDAHGVDASQPLTTELLDRLTELFRCEYATYETHDRLRRVVTAYVPCSNEGASAVPPQPYPESYWTWSNSPHWMHAAFQKLSDACSRRERERSRDRGEFNAESRIVDKLGFRVGDIRTRSGLLHFDSQRRDFDDRDRELALTLRPHVEALWRKAVARTKSGELLAALEADRDAVVVHHADGRIDYATARARRLLTAWFGTRNGRLPAELDAWIALARPGDRFSERRNGSVLVVEAAGGFTLRLSEQRSGGLTPREREVLELVGQGLTNAEIARRLWVAESTVAKHLEQAYAKLGVHSRTAAVARLRQS